MPKYLPLPEFPDGLRVYPDRAEVLTTRDSGGINDIARYNLAIMGLQAGQYVLPTIEIPYFDPEQTVIKTATLTPPPIEIQAAPLLAVENQAVLERSVAQALAGQSAAQPGYWPWATALFAMLWLLTLGAWWRQRLSLPATPIDSSPASTPIIAAGSKLRPLEAQLLHALDCRSLQAGIEHWQRVAPNDQVTLATLRAVQQHYYGTGHAADRGDEEALKAEVQQALMRIQQPPPAGTAANEDWQRRVLQP